MAGVATAARYGVLFQPSPDVFSKNMENYKILNPERAPSWAFKLANSVLNREMGMEFGEQTLLFPIGSGRTPMLVN